VKRTVCLAAGLVALGVVIYVGKLWAQQPGTAGAAAAAPELRTRIAVLNLNYVIKYYKKFINYQEQMKHDLEPYQTKERDKTALRDSLTKELNDPKTPADKRDELQKKIVDVAREIEDNKRDVQKTFMKKQSDMLKIIYGDVQDAASRYARAHNFDMVLHYNDAITMEDYSSVMNIVRKLEQPACMPLYVAPGMDISMQVRDSLNASYQGGAASAVPAAGAAGGQRQ
jgi:Skp family chaperone for outer membrane proteins